jgi:hypothetical protein
MTDTTMLTPERFDAFAETMAIALGDPRKLNAAEARAASAMFWSATQFARITVAQWNLRKRHPTTDEMMRLAWDLRSAEDAVKEMFSGPPSDGHSVDHLIDHFGNQIQKLLQRAAPATPPPKVNHEEPPEPVRQKRKKPWSSANSRSPTPPPTSPNSKFRPRLADGNGRMSSFGHVLFRTPA